MSGGNEGEGKKVQVCVGKPQESHLGGSSRSCKLQLGSAGSSTRSALVAKWTA